MGTLSVYTPAVPATDMTVQQERIEPQQSFTPLKSHAHAMVVCDEYLCIAGKDTTVKILNFDGTEKTSLEGHTYDVNALAMMGNILFSGADAQGSPQRFLKAWDASSGQFLFNLDGHAVGVWALATGAGMLFSGDETGSIRVWTQPGTAECSCARVLEGHAGKVRCLMYNQEESRLYSGGHDNKVLVWDPLTGEQVGSFALGGWITALLEHDGKLLVASTDKTVAVFDKGSSERVAVLTHESWVSSLVCHGDTLFTGVGDATVCVWDAPSATLQGKLKGHMDFHAVSALAVRGDDLFAAGWDGAVCKWDIPALRTELSNRAPVLAITEPVVKDQPVVAAQQSSNIFDEEDCVELLD